MKKLLSLIAVGALVGSAGVAHAGTTTAPNPQDFKNASKFCKEWRAYSGSADDFRSAVDAVTSAKVTTKNAHGKCVSYYAKDEANERSSARKQAITDCKNEREQAQANGTEAAFATKYNARNEASAYGKCVSSNAKANKAEADEKDQERVNAAKWCDEQRGDTPASRAAFAEEYDNFGKCVSKKARSQNPSS